MKKVVIIGGGFTGSMCAMELEKDFSVILIDNKPYFEFTPSILRTILEPIHGKKIQIMHEDYLKKTEIIVGSVKEISKEEVKTDKDTLGFDYLIIASGSDYSNPIKEPELIPASRAKELVSYHDKLEKAKTVSIIGGGLVGVELAAEICTHYKDKKINLIHSHSRLMERNHPNASKYAEKFLRRKGIEIIFEERVIKKDGEFFVTDKGRKIKSDMNFMTVGIKSNYEFMTKNMKNLLNERNQIKVNEFLQVDSYDNIFAGGDITSIKEEKTAQTAEAHSEAIVKNIRNLEGKQPLEKYKSKRRPMVISLGKYTGIFDNGKFAFGGFIPALMKSLIEWKTLMKYR